VLTTGWVRIRFSRLVNGSQLYFSVNPTEPTCRILQHVFQFLWLPPTLLISGDLGVCRFYHFIFVYRLIIVIMN
jgi:hypothetical protein